MTNKKGGKDPVLHIPSDFREEDELAILQDSNDIDKLRSLLVDGEKVYRLVLCSHEDSSGVLAATNKRILFADQRFITSKVVEFKYSEVAAIVYNMQIVTQYIVLVHSSRTLSVDKVDREHGERFIEFVQDAIGGDYTTQGGGHVFRHNDDILRLTDLPSMKEELSNNDEITGA